MAAIAIVPMLFALAAGRDSNLVFVLALAGCLLVRAVVQPVAVLIHELGHAVTAVLLSGQRPAKAAAKTKKPAEAGHEEQEKVR